MSNKVTYGLRNVHIAFRTAAETPAWETPVAIPGAVRFTPTPTGEDSKFYADDTLYFVVSTNDGYTAEIEFAHLPDATMATMLGWDTDDNGMLVENADAVPKRFALLGEVQGDDKNRRFVYYDVQAQRPTKEHTTKAETTTPVTNKIPLTCMPLTLGEGAAAKNIVKGDLELSATNAVQYNGFFDAVYTPVFT